MEVVPQPFPNPRTVWKQIVFESPELGRMGGDLPVDHSRCHDQVDQLMSENVPEYLLGDVGRVQNLMETDKALGCWGCARDATKKRAIRKDDLRGNRYRREKLPPQCIRHPDHVAGRENEERRLPRLVLTV